MSSLELTLLYLLAAVLGVVACRSLKLPPMLGYLVVGVLVGPNDEMSHVPAPGVEHHVCQLADRVVGATHRSAELEPHQ